MTRENESSAKPEMQPEPEPEVKPEPEPEPEPEPVAELTNIRIQVPVSVNDELKALAELWGETKSFTATKLLTGSIQKQYSINKAQGRI